MTAPRHLWSGDWRRESADAARDLADRRAQEDEPSAAETPAPTETPTPAKTRAPAPAPARPKPAAPAPATAAAPRPSAERPVARRQPASRSARAERTGPAERTRPAERTHTPDRERRRLSGPRTVVVVLAALVSAGIAYAVVSTVVGSGNNNSTPPISQAKTPAQAAPATNGPAWLGVRTQSFASAAGGGFSSGSGTGNSGFPSGTGAVVTNVVPGSPADAAGLEPGDVITQINNHTVNSPNDVTATLAGMHAGQQAEIQYQRGPFADAAQVTLAARPPGSP